MNLLAFSPLEAAVPLALAMIGAALFLSLGRLLRGPTLPDRVVATDLIGSVAIGLMAIICIHTGDPVALDVAAVLALVAFVATVAFARYLGRRGRDE